MQCTLRLNSISSGDGTYWDMGFGNLGWVLRYGGNQNITFKGLGNHLVHFHCQFEYFSTQFGKFPTQFLGYYLYFAHNNLQFCTLIFLFVNLHTLVLKSSGSPCIFNGTVLKHTQDLIWIWVTLELYNTCVIPTIPKTNSPFYYLYLQNPEKSWSK